jgi:hypothetical protein
LAAVAVKRNTLDYLVIVNLKIRFMFFTYLALFGLLLTSALVGIGLRFLLTWAFSDTFTLKVNAKQIIASVGVMLVFVGLFTALKADHWFFYFVLAAGGFLTKYSVEKANKIKG